MYISTESPRRDGLAELRVAARRLSRREHVPPEGAGSSKRRVGEVRCLHTRRAAATTRSRSPAVTVEAVRCRCAGSDSSFTLAFIMVAAGQVRQYLLKPLPRVSHGS